MIRVIFFGTSSFAVPSLKRLADDPRFHLVAVVTQPDRPVGRHAALTQSPIKQTALALGLNVLQFEKIKSDDAFEALQKIPADIAVVASFGQIIPQRVLDLYPHGMVNVHGSILPKYRGASPIAAAIRDGETETGVTIMRMDAELDHGPIMATAKEPIRPDDTAGTLHDRLAELGARILPDALVNHVEEIIAPRIQDHAQATFVKLLSREDGLIDWSKPAAEIERLVRAYDPWPGTYTMVDGKRLKILKAALGTIEGYPTKTAGDGNLLTLLRVQPEGKPSMDGRDFLHGNKME